MIDTIRLNGIKALRIYRCPAGRKHPGPGGFEAEITLYLDLVRASQSDNLADNLRLPEHHR